VPSIDPIASIQTQAAVSGNLMYGSIEMTSPISSLRSNKLTSISVGNESNVKDAFYALETIDEDGKPIEKSLADISSEKYALHMGEKVSPVQQFQIHNPVSEGNDKFSGMQALVIKDEVGNDSVIDPNLASNGERIHGDKSGSLSEVITSQAKTDKPTDIPEDCQYNATKKPK
jgi:carbonic anhydrase/acetyltransferase-like protein (isoleucine patch superfamily)